MGLPKLGRARVFGPPLLAMLLLAWGCDSNAPNRDAPTILWRAPDNPFTKPAIVGSLVVFGTSDGNAIAYDRSTGKIVWRRNLGPTITGTGVGVAAGLLIVPEFQLWALRPSDGGIVWQYAGPDGGAGVDEPTVAGDTVFFGSAFGFAGALNAATGVPYWTVDLGERAFRPSVSADLIVYGTAGFRGGPRQGPLGAGHIIALRRSDGSEVWRYPVPDSAGYPGSGGAVTGGVVWQDRVIVGSYASRMYALRLTDGHLLWEHTGGDPHLSPYEEQPAVLGSTVMQSRVDNVVEGIDASSGALLWSLTGVGHADAKVYNGVGYLSGAPLVMLRPDGTVAWRWGSVGDGDLTFPGSVAVDNAGVIYVWGAQTAKSYSEAFAVVPPIKP